MEISPSSRKYSLFLFLVIVCSVFLIACNKEGRQSQDKEEGFLSKLFSSESLPTLDPGEISAMFQDMESSDVMMMQEELRSIYSSRDFEPIWSSDELREGYLKELSQIEKDGLTPDDYHYNNLQELEKTAGESTSQHARFEILLSDSFLKLANDLYYGKLDPEQLHWIWDVERETLDFTELLERMEKSGEVSDVLTTLRPNHEVYQGLVRSLSELRESMKKGEAAFEPIPNGDAIEPGDEDERVPAIAARLQQLGLLNDEAATRNLTYTPELAKAVEAYQERKSMAADGIVGNTTLREMNMTQEDRYNQVLVNLERWRWYPRDLGEHYILINIPQYKLVVVKDGDTIRSHDVIAGTKQRQTPIFSDELEHIVLNPTWTLPPTIKAEDVLPKAANDPSYFSRNNMYVTSPDGETLDPSEVDWSSSQAKNYTITQRAGPTNPLGRVKIMYPNQYSIYLHDTPAQGLFDQAERASSSGCVRVEDALDLANYVVQSQDESSQEEIDEILASGKTTNMAIDQPIKVHHFYWTSWREGGETVFTEDVYSMDQKIATALKGQ